jgi:hypothetical protein
MQQANRLAVVVAAASAGSTTALRGAGQENRHSLCNTPILRALLQASRADLPDTQADHHQTWSCVVFSHPLISICLMSLVPIRLGRLLLPGPTRSGHRL